MKMACYRCSPIHANHQYRHSGTIWNKYHTASSHLHPQTGNRQSLLLHTPWYNYPWHLASSRCRVQHWSREMWPITAKGVGMHSLSSNLTYMLLLFAFTNVKLPQCLHFVFILLSLNLFPDFEWTRREHAFRLILLSWVTDHYRTCVMLLQSNGHKGRVKKEFTSLTSLRFCHRCIQIIVDEV